MLTKIHRHSRIWLTFVFFLVISWTSIHGQGSIAHALLIHRDTTIELDQWLVPGTVQFEDSSYQTYLQVSPQKIQIANWPKGIELPLKYRTFLQHFDTSTPGWSTTQTAPTLIRSNEGLSSFDMISKDGLDYQGSFGRGVQIGNRQSLLLNSEFNLQMAGKLGDDVEIVGALSDNTIPIQPEGDTRRLDEFDKVFLQVTKGAHQIVAGDFQLQKPKGYFLQYFKRLSGLQYNHQDSLDERWRLSSSTAFAAARGKFSRNIIDPIEGTQGPYQLTGNEGQRFLVILAGTEKVFWDGELLQRGADADYIMDYNQGQITFSYNRIVNQNLRIIVEFEYIERDYGRSNTAANVQLASKKTSAFLNVYHHQDSRTPSNFTLDSLSRSILQNAGDQIDMSSLPGERKSTEEDVDRVQYIKADTFYTEAGQRVDTSIFVYTENPNESNAFIVQFSNVGQGNGDYLLANSTANGRVYRWVSPDLEGKPQGTFSPKITINPPEAHTIVTLGGQHELTSHLQVKGEMLLSQRDRNRLSTNDDDDNQGWGAKAEILLDYPVGDDWSLRSGYRHEYVNEKVRVINPFRRAEFARDWNYELTNHQTEQIGRFNAGFHFKNHFFDLHTTRFVRGQRYQGWRHGMDGRWQLKGWKLETHSSFSEQQLSNSSITFLRPQFSLHKSIADGKIGRFKLEWFSENNRQELADSLLQRSFRFDQWSMEWEGQKKGKWQTGLETRHRTDYLPKEGLQSLTSQATDVQAKIRFQPLPQFHLGLNVGWRDFVALDTLLSTSDSRQTLITRLDQSWRWMKSALELQTIYEISSGQEPLLEFVFEERRPGEGQYIYEDLNGDGIPQVNEFISAPFVDTARYVRIQLINNNFVTTNNLLFSQNLKIRPAKFWKDRAPRWAQKLMWTSLVKTNDKTRDDYAWNPYQIEQGSASNMLFSTLQQHNLFINRGDPKFDIHLGYRLNSSNNNLVSGMESQKSTTYTLRTRYNVGRTTEMVLNGLRTKQNNDSQFFPERRFALDKNRWGISNNWVWRQALRVVTELNWEQIRNVARDDGERLRQWSTMIRVSYRKAQTYNIQLGLGYALVNYQSLGNQVLDFIMLQEKRDGENYNWKVQFDQMLFNNVQMSLSYNGRKNGSGRSLHQGQATFKANF